MARDRVESVCAKELAFSANVRRRVFLMLKRRVRLCEQKIKWKEHLLSDGLTDDLTSISLRFEQDIPFVVKYFQL